MSMRNKLLLLNIPTMVVGALKRANKATNERIGQLNTELRKKSSKKGTLGWALMSVYLKTLTTKLIYKA